MRPSPDFEAITQHVWSAQEALRNLRDAIEACEPEDFDPLLGLLMADELSEIGKLAQGVGIDFAALADSHEGAANA